MKTFYNVLIISVLLYIIPSCSPDDPETPQTPDAEETPVEEVEVINIFEKLQGNTYQQIEKASDCSSCEDEVNYYMFSADAIQITGTTLDGTCEQNDYQSIGNCDDCVVIEENTPDKLTICIGSDSIACQTITFLSDTEIQFDFPAFNQTWTAELHNENVPCTDWSPIGDGPDTVFAKLQGNTYQQIESADDCLTCEEEINYYKFSIEGLQITGTTSDGTCEQNDFSAIGDCDDCAYIEENTNEKLTVCVGTFLKVCQTITFLSETEIQFDFPAFNQTWTAQLFEGDVPCLDFNGTPDPIFSGTFNGTVWDNGVFEFPTGSSVADYAGFANENTTIYPLSFPDGGDVTFTAATSGVDIDVRFRFEKNTWPDTEPSFETAVITVSGTDAKEYTVEIPPQGDNTFNSALFYLNTRDQRLTASNFVITSN